MYDDTIKEKFVFLRSRGMPFGKISKELGVAKATLINWNSEFKETISTQQQEFINELREKYKVSVTQSMELFGERLNDIRREIKKKGVGDLKIKQLLELEVNYIKILDDL
ncbi:MAG: transposase [Nitrospinales bacterium]|jgi:transposase